MIDPLDHIRELSQVIGPRPSTGEGERKAAEYVSTQLEKFGYLVKQDTGDFTMNGVYFGAVLRY